MYSVVLYNLSIFTKFRDFDFYNQQKLSPNHLQASSKKTKANKILNIKTCKNFGGFECKIKNATTSKVSGKQYKNVCLYEYE